MKTFKGSELRVLESLLSGKTAGQFLGSSTYFFQYLDLSYQSQSNLLSVNFSDLRCQLYSHFCCCLYLCRFVG